MLNNEWVYFTHTFGKLPMENVRKGRLLENKLKMLQWENVVFCLSRSLNAGGVRRLAVAWDFVLAWRATLEVENCNAQTSIRASWGEMVSPCEKLSASLCSPFNKKNPVLISINAKLFSISFFKSHFFFFVFLVVFLNRTSSVVFSSSSF